ncbi:XdhC family protein [Jannaschia seohaensis]|uniref:Xanthine dehydrogenase accessory factor n=1 Tax=Jannaschia seohaensis TaxID=475081 RepID=A0A2Y9C7S6_9RHOB|nr:XdhC family protein [Jannaschia seohaensis]PWJ18098.1 xanthine dehydrogenase accessory factor [Jannaschia seohaensis]SSA46623.1 xanthine dehydrogenase accessory factor [Jannaschia seohaensis]
MRESLDDAPKAALDWHRAGKGAALATVIETWGSAPRPVGSQLAISEDAELVGSVSGGCVEGAVVAEALDAMGDGRHRVLEYGVSDDEAFAVGLACGGTIRILLEPVGGTLPPDLLEELTTRRDRSEPVGQVVDIETGATHLTSDVAERLRATGSGFEPESARFVTLHAPPLRLAVVGGVHIAQALVPMARLAGYAPTVIDPREAFASAARFPETPLVHDWPDEAMRAFAPDARSAVVLLTHDPKLDDPALIEALRSPAFYVGALGSTRTHAKRVARLAEAGLTAEEIARIDAPIGLDIGARSPGEIAVAILAAMIQALRRP